MTAQALLGQTYSSQADLWAGLDERRQVLNRHLPSRALAHQAPLEAYPQALHSGRAYRTEWEEELLALERVFLKNDTPLGLRLMQLIQGFE